MGDFVFLAIGNPDKIGDQYTGPHKILEVISKSNYRILINKGSKVVNVNRLKHSYIRKQCPAKKRPEKGITVLK